MSRLSVLIVAALLPACLEAAPVDVLFVGNSYTFGRVDPVMSYNAANVNDMTRPELGGSFANTSGSNSFEPHPWGGVAGIFKQFTMQAGLDPSLLGDSEIAARDLGIDSRSALLLQRVAANQLGFTVPTPASAPLVLLAQGPLALLRKRGAQ